MDARTGGWLQGVDVEVVRGLPDAGETASASVWRAGTDSQGRLAIPAALAAEPWLHLEAPGHVEAFVPLARSVRESTVLLVPSTSSAVAVVPRRAGTASRGAEVLADPVDPVTGVTQSGGLLVRGSSGEVHRAPRARARLAADGTATVTGLLPELRYRFRIEARHASDVLALTPATQVGVPPDRIEFRGAFRDPSMLVSFEPAPSGPAVCYVSPTIPGQPATRRSLDTPTVWLGPSSMPPGPFTLGAWGAGWESESTVVDPGKIGAAYELTLRTHETESVWIEPVGPGIPNDLRALGVFGLDAESLRWVRYSGTPAGGGGEAVLYAEDRVVLHGMALPTACLVVDFEQGDYRRIDVTGPGAVHCSFDQNPIVVVTNGPSIAKRTRDRFGSHGAQLFLEMALSERNLPPTWILLQYIPLVGKKADALETWTRRANGKRGFRVRIETAQGTEVVPVAFTIR